MNNQVLFQLYLVLIIVFLIPICLFISIGIQKVYYQNILIHSLMSNKNFRTIDIHNSFKIIKTYINIKRWLSCILMLEFFIEQKANNIEEYYKYLGLCYENIEVNSLAQQYYQRALKIDPKNVFILQHLGKIQKLAGETQKALQTYKVILSIDRTNQIAMNYLDSHDKV
uniref:Uncharacterized protein n=1 Tax=Schizymenia dubyi TaxID=38368 RepID=A0A1C9C9B7_9FLOR|nr:hypothetical protein Schiz_107 [Schizymenia dubyi]AOM64990.1 hypothetical protein Schiz_107 [Schizymenia dubyi]